jgi:hypothetical protein
MFKKILYNRRDPAYQSFETGIKYEFPFKGGFSWPQNSQSFLCIIGQEAVSGIMRVLAEYEEDNLSDLARRCNTLKGLYRNSSWIAQNEGDFKSYEDALDKFAKDDGFSIHLHHPSMVWDLNLAIQIIRGKMRQNKLQLPKDGILQKQIEKINREASLAEPEKMTVFSPILVLAMVIFEFDSLPEEDDEDLPRDRWADAFKDDGGPRNWMAM